MQSSHRVLKSIVTASGMVAGLAAAAGVFGAAGTARAGDLPPSAAFVLEVDVTDPANVVVRSAGGASQVTGGGTGYGVMLDGFFTNYLNQATLLPVTLAPTVGGGFNVASTQARGSTPGLLDFNGGGNRTQLFTQGVTAFTGSVTIPNFSTSFPTPSPVGTIGSVIIRTDFNVNTGQVIGQYRIVPTPGTVAAALAMLGLTGASRRRRQR